MLIVGHAYGNPHFNTFGPNWTSKAPSQTLSSLRGTAKADNSAVLGVVVPWDLLFDAFGGHLTSQSLLVHVVLTNKR